MKVENFTIYQQVEEINKYLEVIIGKKNLSAWWDSPNKALGGETPLNSLPKDYELLLVNIKRAYENIMNGDYS